MMVCTLDPILDVPALDPFGLGQRSLHVEVRRQFQLERIRTRIPVFFHRAVSSVSLGRIDLVRTDRSRLL